MSEFPLTAMLLFALLPNVLASVFNYVYNWRIIVHPMQSRGVAQAANLFVHTSTVVNGIGFAVGIAIFVHMAQPLRKALGSLREGPDEISRAVLLKARSRCLRLAHWAALLGAGIWLAAGPIYPAMLGTMMFRDYAFFTASLLFCGLIAAAYPFFGVAWLCTRFIYAELTPPGSGHGSDQIALQTLEERSWHYLALAGSLPMLTIAAGLVLSPWAASNANAVLLGVLGFAGFAAFFVAIGLFRGIQRNVRVLKDVVRFSTPRD